MGLLTNMSPGLVGAAAVVFPVVGAVLITARLAGRMQSKMRLGADDWLVVTALFFMVGMGIATVYGIAKGVVGYHTPTDKAGFARAFSIVCAVFWNVEWMQPLALGCIKMSFIFFYRRIFNVPPKQTATFNIITIITLVILGIWTIGFFLAVMLLCPGHVSANWSPTAERAKYCWKTTNFIYALCWSDVGTDILIILLPIAPILKLNMSLARKLAVIGIFLLGLITLCASVVRATLYVYLLNSRDAGSQDISMLDTNGIYWMLLETGLAMIAVNLPVLYGLVKRHQLSFIVHYVKDVVSTVTRHRSSAHSSHSSDRESDREKINVSSRVHSIETV